MHGPHDLGGREGLGPRRSGVPQTRHPGLALPVRGRMHAITAMAIAKGAFNLDEQRHGIELMKWSDYLDSTYYAHWLFSVEKLLNDKGYISHEEVDDRMRELGAPSMTPHPQKPDTLSPFAEQMIDVLWKGGTPHDVPAEAPPAYEVGAEVMVRNLREATHNRLPGYLPKAKGGSSSSSTARSTTPRQVRTDRSTRPTSSTWCGSPPRSCGGVRKPPRNSICTPTCSRPTSSRPEPRRTLKWIGFHCPTSRRGSTRWSR